MLLGCYRTGAANDPEVYIAAVVRVLSAYPMSIVHRVIDPVTGLPGRTKWLPTIPEINEACEELADRERRIAQMDDQAERQLEVRRQWEASRAQPRPSLDDLKAKHGPNWGLNSEATEEDRERRKKHLDSIAKANKRIFEAECAAAGIDPAKGVSPSLLNLMQVRQASGAA